MDAMETVVDWQNLRQFGIDVFDLEIVGIRNTLKCDHCNILTDSSTKCAYLLLFL